ncbi:peroxisome assembly protein 26 [Erpetoichthys calabaricus]|uniref:Peroxisome assembly protein 26 n=1 Tax=Erpetoichthys calabaricus TaxID=27687 RepID=A0A8C4RST9_ERPCA|nr:peroxisome assembly protein 26 [Erpetoichthys calabaricus]XP_028661455.1 peroxisome assembly protein 26 [Erpetoichthys calabaricus]
MRSNSSTSLCQRRSLGSVHPGSSPAIFQSSGQALPYLDSAVELLMVQRDFCLALETCEKGLESINSLSELDDSTSSYRCGEMKIAFCIIGVQALAELNEWKSVLNWLLQYYGTPEKLPAKIMQMCILLFTKVDEPGIIFESGKEWLRSPSNHCCLGFNTVAELFLLHVLIPMGKLKDAETLAGNGVTFNDEQCQVVMEIIKQKREEKNGIPDPDPASQIQASSTLTSKQRFSSKCLLPLVRLLQRGFLLIRRGVCSIPLQKVVLAVMILFLLLMRIDPALPSALPWISSLLQMLRHMWDTMFAPYYRAKVSH